MAIGPIGIFDSGVGGLTVVAELVRRNPSLDFIYLGDTARVPYGTKSPKVVQTYSERIARLLIKEGASSIIIACNTASAYALEHLKSVLDVPVMGVIKPGAKRALELTNNGHIGVIGTLGTIDSRSYVEAIKEYRPDAKIFTQACPLLVPLAEEGYEGHDATRLIVDEYLTPFRDTQIDTLVLGCTHYPLLYNDIQRVVGPEVTLIHSGEAMWATLVRENFPLPESEEPTRRYLATDTGSRVRRLAKRFLGEESVAVEHIDLI